MAQNIGARGNAILEVDEYTYIVQPRFTSLAVAPEVVAPEYVIFRGELNSKYLSSLAVGRLGVGVEVPSVTLEVKGNTFITGDLNVSGTKNFNIQDPRYKNDVSRRLVHSALEGSEAAVYYRGRAKLQRGRVTIQLPDYFEALTAKEERTVQLTPINGFSPLFLHGEVEDSKFEVMTTVHGREDQEFFWEVKAVRKDIPRLEVERVVYK